MKKDLSEKNNEYTIVMVCTLGEKIPAIDKQFW